MFIIIKRIADTISLADIEDFVLPIIKSEFTNKHGALKSIQIFTLLDKKTGILERHGLVRVGPDNIITPLIKALLHGTLQNNRYTIEPYFVRHWHNDRRAHKPHHQVYTHHNNRHSERRRPSLERVVIAEKVLI